MFLIFIMSFCYLQVNGKQGKQYTRLRLSKDTTENIIALIVISALPILINSCKEWACNTKVNSLSNLEYFETFITFQSQYQNLFMPSACLILLFFYRSLFQKTKSVYSQVFNKGGTFINFLKIFRPTWSLLGPPTY